MLARQRESSEALARIFARRYRVRLRVVEEHEVALMAESAEDAKARAEAEIRSGEFESIEDSWPEEVVSVEALPVEGYPDLE